MSLITDFQDWINATFYRNDRRLITGAHANTLGHKCIENFAVKGEAIPQYSRTILDTDLDGNNQIIITHNLDTNIPQLIMYDEDGYKVNITSYCKTKTDDSAPSNKLEITFFDDIPTSGVGYYTLYILKFVESVAAPYSLFFDDNFDSTWTTIEGADSNYYPIPVGWNVFDQYTLDGVDYYLENTVDGCLIHDIGQGSFVMEADYLSNGERYRIEIKTTAPMIFDNGTDQYNIDGVALLDFTISGGGTPTIKLDGVTEGTIKYFRIYEYQ